MSISVNRHIFHSLSIQDAEIEMVLIEMYILEIQLDTVGSN